MPQQLPSSGAQCAPGDAAALSPTAIQPKEPFAETRIRASRSASQHWCTSVTERCGLMKVSAADQHLPSATHLLRDRGRPLHCGSLATILAVRQPGRRPRRCRLLPAQLGSLGQLQGGFVLRRTPVIAPVIQCLQHRAPLRAVLAPFRASNARQPLTHGCTRLIRGGGADLQRQQRDKGADLQGQQGTKVLTYRDTKGTKVLTYMDNKGKRC